MPLKDKIRIFERNKIVDERGWFLKVITGQEEDLPAFTGEVYLISAHPGETRANHYHKEASEWFTLVQGKAKMYIEDIATKEQMLILLDSAKPVTVFIPPGIAHEFLNADNDPYILIAYANKQYHPADTVPFKIAK